jgi:sugar phosphate isomerase/epimerase
MTIPLILSTGSLYNFDISTVMALAGEAGFDGVELMVDWRQETFHRPHLEKLMRQHDLPILAVHSPFAFMRLQGWPVDPVEIVHKSVQLAKNLGAQTVVVHPPTRWVRFQGIVAGPQRSWKISLPLPVVGPGRLGRWLWCELPDFQARSRVKIAVENMPCRHVGPFKLDPFHFTRPEQLNHFQFLTFDTTHAGTRQLDLLDFYRQIKPKVAHVHLSNYNGREHQLLNNGHLPLAALLAELVEDRFDGLVSVELNPASLQAEDDAVLQQNLRETVSFCRKVLSPAQAQR